MIFRFKTLGVLTPSSSQVIIASNQSIAFEIEKINPKLRPYVIPYYGSLPFFSPVEDFEIPADKNASQLIEKIAMRYPNSRINYFWTNPTREPDEDLKYENRRNFLFYLRKKFEVAVNEVWGNVINRNLIFLWDKECIEREEDYGWINVRMRPFWGLNAKDSLNHRLEDYKDLVMKGAGIGE